MLFAGVVWYMLFVVSCVLMSAVCRILVCAVVCSCCVLCAVVCHALLSDLCCCLVFGVCRMLLLFGGWLVIIRYCSLVVVRRSLCVVCHSLCVVVCCVAFGAVC